MSIAQRLYYQKLPTVWINYNCMRLDPYVNELHQRYTDHRQQVHRSNPSTTMGHTGRRTKVMTSVAPQKHFQNMPLKQLRTEDPQALIGSNCCQWRPNQHQRSQTDVNCAIMGLDAIMKNGLRLTVNGYQGYLGHDGAEVKLHYISNLIESLLPQSDSV
eukprot:2613251-Amphidinium_carterae.9